MKRAVVFSIFIGVLLVSCAQATPAPPTPTLIAETFNAATFFAENCASCHGLAGEGQTGPALTHLDDHSDDELIQIITNGRSETGMPPWGDRLTRDKVVTLIGYLRTLGPGEEEEHGEALSAASLDLTLSLSGEQVVARVTLKDKEGMPLSRQEISFNLLITLGGSLPLGTATTDAQGVAEFRYDPGEAPSLHLEAVYQPNTESEPVRAQAEIEMPGGAEIPPLSLGLFSPSPPLPAILVLGAVVGGVWLTYAWVGWQLLGIIRTRK